MEITGTSLLQSVMHNRLFVTLERYNYLLSQLLLFTADCYSKLPRSRFQKGSLCRKVAIPTMLQYTVLDYSVFSYRISCLLDSVVDVVSIAKPVAEHFHLRLYKDVHINIVDPKVNKNIKINCLN